MASNNTSNEINGHRSVKKGLKIENNMTAITAIADTVAPITKTDASSS